MLHPAHRVGPIAAFEPLYLALAQLQHSQSPSLAENFSDSSPPSLEGDRISLQLGGDIILEHLHPVVPAIARRPPLCYSRKFSRILPISLEVISSCLPSNSAGLISSHSIVCFPTTSAWSATPPASSSRTISFPSSRNVTAPAASRANWSIPSRRWAFSERTRR